MACLRYLICGGHLLAALFIAADLRGAEIDSDLPPRISITARLPHRILLEFGSTSSVQADRSLQKIERNAKEVGRGAFSWFDIELYGGIKKCRISLF
ncbi:unnamed protein product, partial [Iphiclides podalirius]